MEKYKKEFPFLKTKIKNISKKFNLADPVERKDYFKQKVGQEIALIDEYLKNNTFIAYWLGKKNAGKGTYTKLMMEIFGDDKIGHISIGDIIRTVHEDMNDEAGKRELTDYLSNNYRGYISVEKTIDALLNREAKSLLPTEFILTLIKREIDKIDKKTLFIDGFPRDLDQISYSLFFRDLINYRDDPDVFVAIDIPEPVIDMRMRNRVVCPKCHTPRSLKILPTKKIVYDQDKKEFYLICDNPECNEARMVGKEGDEFGIESIRERLELDGKLIEKIFSLHGVPKILLRNTIPVRMAEEHVDDYEITPEYVHKFDPENKQVKTKEKPWLVKNDQGEESYSLLAPPVVIDLIKQLVKVLKLT